MRVAIDAGHGSWTAGKRSVPFANAVTSTYAGNKITVKKGESLREHVANVGVAHYLTKELERCGFEVFKTGWNDINGVDDLTDLSIIDRQTAIRKAKCDYSISCHFNAFGDAKSFNVGQGCETLYHTVPSKVGDGKNMATAIQKQLSKTFQNQKNRGIVGGSTWGMCNSIGLGVKAAVIVECAFMTNQYEAENYFANPYAWYKYAVQIAKGFCDYTGITYLPYVPTAPITSSSTVDDIAWLQEKLNRSGSQLDMDGVYGPKSAHAVKNYYNLKGWKMADNFTGYYTGAGTIKELLA